MPVTSPGGQQAYTTTETIGQVFIRLGLWQWWQQNNGNGTNPYNGLTEKGIDYSTTFGTPVGVPVGGRVVRLVHNNNSIGDVVELQTADGAVWLYQHITARVRVGSVLLVGDVIGTENGLPVDQYSTGPHIEVRYCKPGTWNGSIDSWSEPWVNPYGVFSGLSWQVAGSVGSGASSGASPGFSLSNIPGVSLLAPSASVAEVCAAIDTALLVTNPFDVSTVQASQQSNNNQGLDWGGAPASADPAAWAIWLGGEAANAVATAPATVLGLPNPVAWLDAVLINLFYDTEAIVFRSLLIFIGFLLLLKVLFAFIDFGSIVGGVTKIAELAVL